MIWHTHQPRQRGSHTSRTRTRLTLDGELGFPEDALHVSAGKRDLGGGGEGHVRVSDLVYVVRQSALVLGLEPRALDHRHAREVRREHGRETPCDEPLHGPLREGQLEQRGLLQQVVEARPRHARRSLEVNQPVQARQLHVVARDKARRPVRGQAPAFCVHVRQLPRLGLAAHGSSRVRRVRQLEGQRV